MTAARLKPLAILAATAFALAACEPVRPERSPAPVMRPAPAPAPAVTAPSETSRALRDYYARVQQTYLTQGLLRTDGGGPDTPFSRRQLVDNFVRIALFEEFSTVGGRLVRRENATPLHRWTTPVRLGITFGDSVPLAQRDRDRAAIDRFAARLARLTGLDISLGQADPNYYVFIVGEDERRALGPRLRAISPDVDAAAVDTVQNMRRSTLCLVFAIDGGETGVYSQAVAVIRAEHPDLLRLSCIQEELAQGLGLPNDSPSARPSVFNDDEEFGLLTTQDEMLLRMLYDPRLRPGMTESEVRPIAAQIAAEMLGGDA